MQRLPLIRLDNVSAGFGDHLVFSGLSLSLYAGEHCALLGPNGAGKSTLMRLLQGELRPAQAGSLSARHSLPDRPGRVLFGFEGTQDASVLAAREHVRMVSPAQQRNYARQGWKITGEEILLSGMGNAAMLYGEPPPHHSWRAAALAEAAGAAHLLTLLAPAMSQGQLRLALILRALMSRPALLLLDEPFDGLDGPAREYAARAIALAMQRGTVLISAHRREDIPPGINHALLLERGTVRRIPLEAAGKLNGANAEAPREERAAPDAKRDATRRNAAPDASPPRAQEFFADSPFARRLLSGRAPLLRLEHVDVFIERGKVLSDICWTVNPGEQWIVSGRNGSGKSTLLRLLYGEEFAAFGGTLDWCGEPRPALADLRKGVGYVSDRLQDVHDDDLFAEDVVLSGFSGHIGLHREHFPQERALARFWLEKMGAGSAAGARFHSLSSGVMRRVLLARALAGAPPVLLLDEPLSGLDESGRRFFLDSLHGLARQGVHIIYVSHHEEDKSELFSHELRLEQGRVAYAGPRRAKG